MSSLTLETLRSHLKIWHINDFWHLPIKTPKEPNNQDKCKNAREYPFLRLDINCKIKNGDFLGRHR